MIDYSKRVGIAKNKNIISVGRFQNISPISNNIQVSIILFPIYFTGGLW